MKSMARWLGVAVSLGLLAISLPARAGDEVILTEPLDSTLYFGIFQSIYQQPAVMRPETLCGNPGGSATNLIPCFEFAMTYFTYDSTGRQRAHLSQCNRVPADDPGCELPANDLCAGNLTLDKFQIMAPVCGEIRVDVLPITTPGPLTLGAQPTATWDGVSRTVIHQVYFDFIAADGRYLANTFRLPLIRMPASAVVPLDGLPVVSLVIGRHTSLSGANFNFGFYNIINRVFPYNQTLGDVTNLIAEPLLMTR